MVLKGAYVVGRGASGRPTCQHKLVDGRSTQAACGQDMSQWSRSYTSGPIEAILCKKAGCWAPTKKRTER